eukprot:7641943-Lingulodinium_polyedra.AAC.1
MKSGGGHRFGPPCGGGLLLAKTMVGHVGALPPGTRACVWRRRLAAAPLAGRQGPHPVGAA